MAYGARFSRKPECWGTPENYDPEDRECQNCRHIHSCRQEVDSKVSTRSSPSIRTTSRRVVSSSGKRKRGTYTSTGTRSRTNLVDYELGVVEEDERPIERVAKDVTMAAGTGAIHALHEFFRKFKWF